MKTREMFPSYVLEEDILVGKRHWLFSNLLVIFGYGKESVVLCSGPVTCSLLKDSLSHCEISNIT